MGIAYAATEGGGHGEEHSIGETILHHVQDTHVFDLWPLGHVTCRNSTFSESISRSPSISS